MITKIIMDDIASYKKPVEIETDKKINLIYGLNGTGKSTLSNYLYSTNNSCYSNCSTIGLGDEEVLVYNQQFVKDYFYTPNGLKSIFTLSKENKAAIENVKSANTKIDQYGKEKSDKEIEKTIYEKDFVSNKYLAENKAWEIKSQFSGGDRVFEYCLMGLMGKKESLFNYLSGVEKPLKQPSKTISELKKEIESIHGNDAQKYKFLPLLSLNNRRVEIDEIFSKVIIGNENSSISELIIKLGNSDWIKDGLGFLPDTVNEDGELCPFCQSRTITRKLQESIRGYFDKSYDDSINKIKRLLSDYENEINKIPSIEEYKSNVFILNRKMDFENQYKEVVKGLTDNKLRMADKLKAPSHQIQLKNTDTIINSFNLFIKSINDEILVHNMKIDNKDATLKEIKKQFWDIMRWDYDQTLLHYQRTKVDLEKKIKDKVKEIGDIDKSIATQKNIIVEQQKKTINIEEAISNINNGLLELGIDSFFIEKHSDNLYKIVRSEKCDDTFQTLSEGEKMIISFLYFRELCKGKQNASSNSRKKVVVIDDPISSLSHIYIFNVGQLIKNEFFNSQEIEQVFVLTHSLYFFYELTDPKHERREKNQKLYRLAKNGHGTSITVMSYEEIQNDYHSYWNVVKDEKQQPALIANCMRNIIEYFFNFIEKKDLNNVFQKPELQQTKYQAFCRFVNRESHSLGQNIFDYKEFDYSSFKEALGMVFTLSGYKEHYEKMFK